jgi:hypothetical protein
MGQRLFVSYARWIQAVLVRFPKCLLTNRLSELDACQVSTASQAVLERLRALIPVNAGHVQRAYQHPRRVPITWGFRDSYPSGATFL